MDTALSKTLRERERILARIGRQRADVALAIHGLATPIAVLDRATVVARYLCARPALVGIAVAVLVALRTRSATGLLARGFGLWRVASRLRALVRRYGF